MSDAAGLMEDLGLDIYADYPPVGRENDPDWDPDDYVHPDENDPDR